MVVMIAADLDPSVGGGGSSDGLSVGGGTSVAAGQ